MKIVTSLAAASLVLASCVVSSSALPPRPAEVEISARVKQHRSGAAGDLVEGEEDLRKIIVGWEHIDDADLYEICHECDIDDSTGERSGARGKVRQIEPEDTCGGKPCMVMPGAPIGYNRFNLRVKVGDEWSPWSKHRNYNVQDVGPVEHEEL